MVLPRGGYSRLSHRVGREERALAFLYPTFAFVLIISSAYSHDWAPLARAGVGMAAMIILYLPIQRSDPAVINNSDILLAGLVGAVLGYLSWAALIVGMILGHLLGDLADAVLPRIRPSRPRVPFGPFAALGGLVAVFSAHPIAAGLLHLM